VAAPRPPGLVVVRTLRQDEPTVDREGVAA